MTKAEEKELEFRLKLLTLQKERLIKRWKAKKLREAFVRKNMKKILSLSMAGWPRTKNMKDYIKWLDLIFDAKIKGVYSIGTANCDIIAMLERAAKEINEASKAIH